MDKNKHNFDKAVLKQIASEAVAQPGGVDIRDRKYRWTTYEKCFIGKDFVKWLQ